MKNTNGTVRLLVQVGVILLAGAAIWGAVRHQVVDNTDDIKVIKESDMPKKLDKEVFSMYLDQRQKADDKRDKKLDKMDEKLDKALAK